MAIRVAAEDELKIDYCLPCNRAFGSSESGLTDVVYDGVRFKTHPHCAPAWATMAQHIRKALVAYAKERQNGAGRGVQKTAG
jgi:hypothetical protein